MCRYHVLWGSTFIAFGFGVVVGLWLEGGFFCFCFGLFMVLLGYFFLKNKHG